jgi:methionyl-tRNA formyltransferase
MKVIFMGTPEFAVPSLDAVLGVAEVAAVVTRPDKPRGRGLRVMPPPIAVAATQYALDVLQPATLRDPELLRHLSGLGADLIVVVAFGRIISAELLAVAPLGGVNLHPSLLPLYRGAAPIARAIAAGETETGVTVLHVSEELDAGDIILQRAVPIAPEDTTATLEARLAQEGGALLAEALRLLEAGRAPRRPQDPTRATFAPKLTIEEAAIRWSDPARTIVNLVRALNPWPIAYAVRDGAPLKIWRAAAVESHAPALPPATPGTVLAAGSDALVVAAGEGAVKVLEVQAASGRRMAAADYLRGHPVPPGTLLGPLPDQCPERVRDHA